MARLDPFDRPRTARHSVAGEAEIYRDRARRLGLPFVTRVDLPPGPAPHVEAIHRGAIAIASGGDRAAYIAPEEDALPSIADWLVRYRGARPRLSVATPSVIRAGLIAAGAAEFADAAVTRLRRLDPDLSARHVLTSRQVATGLATAACLVGLFAAAPTATLVGLNMVGALFFFAVTVLRFVAAGLVAGRVPIGRAMAHRSDDGLPVYTVLVPLYQEAEMVRDLVSALDRIDWPRDRLDIKLIVEEADMATAAVARAAIGGRHTR